jgi:MFS family permease
MDNSTMEDIACPYLHCRSVHLVSIFKIKKKRRPPLSIILISSWGITAICAGTVHNMAGLIVDRCFLGIFEAAFGAGAPYFLSLFYHRRELGLRVSILLGTSPLANCFASALAYGITQIKHSIAPWRLLFLIGKFVINAIKSE